MTDPRRTRTPETWDKARADYLAGHTAEAVCARYDLGLSAFYKNARKDGWRRADQPDPQPLDDDEDALPDADLEATVDLALRRMAASVRRGRAADALRWQRLHAGLSDRLQPRPSAPRTTAARPSRTASPSNAKPACVPPCRRTPPAKTTSAPTTPTGRPSRRSK